MSKPALKDKKTNKSSTTARFNQSRKIQSQDIFPLILLLLYIVTGIIPSLGAVDVMGSQWLYIACLNFISLGYIVWKRQNFYTAIQQVSRSAFTILFITLFIIVGFSIFSAINKTESFVAYTRLTNTIGAFFSVAILLNNRLHLINIAGKVIVALLFIECFKTLSDFFNGLGEIELDKLIFNLKGNTGNKNVLSASIAIKIPFAIYYIRNSNTTARILYSIGIGLAALCIFIINARATYVSLLLVILIYAIYSLALVYKKQIKIRESIAHLSHLLLPIVLAFLLAQQLLGRALREQQISSAYGTVTQRLGEIGLTSSGSGGRTLLWINAIDFIKKHPFKGCGYGNWKLAAIPYDKAIYDDFNVSYHAHNDFLEITAESGLLAGLLYLGLFLCIAFYTLKTLFTKGITQTKQLAISLLMAFGVYFIDACLNFPNERPVMQIYFVLIAAFALTCFNDFKKDKVIITTGSPFWSLILLTGFLILSVPALWISRQVYQSLVLQAYVNEDSFKEKPEGHWQDYINAFPSIPNLNVRCIPTEVLIARYMMADKKYDMALSYLTKSKKANPYLGYDALLKTQIFNSLQNLDSAFYYAKETFYTKPRTQYNYQVLNKISVARKDSNVLKNSFREYIKYRNEPWAWNEYIYSLSAISYPTSRLVSITDSALKLFPDNKDLQQKKLALSQPSTGQNSSPLKNVTPSSNINSTVSNYPGEIMDYFAKASAAYSKADYTTALNYFLKISQLDNQDHLSLENAGLCYLAMHDYKNAILYLDRSLQKNRSTDGRAEFYKGKALYFLGKTTEACEYFKLANSKKYAEAPEYVKMACK